MKRCPECRRDYYDHTLLYCLDDGSALLEGPASVDEPATAILHSSGEPKTAIFGTDLLINTPNSIAVLPFTHMSSGEDNEYFCDGLAEELINALSKIDELKVAARTSAFSFKGKETDIPEIAKKLGVKTVLEGSVRKSGDRLRITVQLINASDGYHLWSERYDREMKDIFDVQDEITLAVVDTLKLKLLGEEKNAVLKRHTNNSEAYELYLRGLSYINRFEPEDFQKAIESFRQAIAIDPGYAAAYAGLSNAYTEMAFRSSPGDWMTKAKEATSKALDLDDTLGEAHTSLGVIKMYYDWDFAGAEAEFKRALALDPGSAHIHMWYGWYLGLMGRFDEGLEKYQGAWELDPLSDPINLGIGVNFHWSGQPTRAIERFRRVLELSPTCYIVYPFLVEAYELTGDFVSAIAEIENVRDEVNDPMALSAFADVYAKAGNRAQALEILKELEKRSSEGYMAAFNIAQIYAGLGDNEEAFVWLEKAYAERSLWLSFLLVDPKFDPLRSEARLSGPHAAGRTAGIERMKKCPQCGRGYNDDSLSYCLDDGSELLFGPASDDEPATAILSEPPASAGGQFSESATRPQIHTTDRAVALNASADKRTARSFDKRLLLAPVALAVIVLAGFAGHKYFKAASGEQINSIAVLPFQNRSDDADTEYLSDGLAESLIFRLTQLPGLKVSPASSVFRYKGKETDLAKIAAELGVDAVMTGRLAKRGDNLNITVELVDARNNKSLWGEQYERKMADLLATQREIAATITQKLQLKLGGNDKGVTKRYTENNEAYQLWLKARYHFTKRTREDLFKSIEIFEQAVILDPKFALAYVGIAESWTVIPSFPYASPAECIPKAKAAAEKALELDPELPEAHTVSAMIAATYEWDWARAEAGFKKALELDPNVSITHYRYAWTYLSPMGRHAEAIAEMKIAMEKEPLYLIQGANYAAVLMYARRFDEAVEQAKKTYDLDPNFIGGRNWLGHTYAAKGMYAEALTLVEKHLDSDMPLLSTAGYSYSKVGQRDRALRIIEQWKEVEKKKYVQNYWVAITYAAVGDKDGAFAELEKAYQNRDWFLQRIKVDPFMDPLRDDPRFDEFVKKLNFPQ